MQHVFLTRPVGVFERDPFSSGTRQLMNYVANLTKEGVMTVIGKCISFVEDDLEIQSLFL